MEKEQLYGQQRAHAAGRGLRVSRQWGLWLFAWLMLISRCQANDVVTAYILGGRPEKIYRQTLERRAMQKVDTTRIACELSSEETEKLRRAALGDVVRAMHELSVLRHVTENMETSNPEHNRKAIQLVQPFLVRVQGGLHGKGSLFAKYLEHALDESQQSRYENYLAEKERERHHLITLTTVMAIDQRVPLLKAQREQLIELIDQRPLPEFKDFSETLLGYIRLSQIPEAELNAFLDAEQTKYILKICQPYQAILGQRR